MKLFRLFGIKVTLRLDALFTPLMIFLLFWLDKGIEPALIYAGPITLLLWLSILWHEFGHALESLRHGRPVKGISLWALGGVAVLETLEKSTPLEDLQIVAAGPLSSILLASLGLWVAMIPISYCTLFGITLFSINIVLTVFNLLPIYPMDGGRILVSILQMASDDLVSGIRIGTMVSMVLTVLLGLVGLLIGHVFLVLIMYFAFRIAYQVYRQAHFIPIFERKEMTHAQAMQLAMHESMHEVDREALMGFLIEQTKEFDQESFWDSKVVLTPEIFLQGDEEQEGSDESD